MVEMRLARDSEIGCLKEIWKLCFGDDDTYIDFYFSQKYKENETVVLLYNQVVAAMATMIHLEMVMPSDEKIDSSMLYAIATHPQYQGRGFSSQIMTFCDHYLIGQGKASSILVPAEESLYDFYNKRGYKEGFYNRIIKLTGDQILELKTNIKEVISIEPISASDYNKRRRQFLKGSLYVDYNDEEIDHQKKTSRQYGGDIYGINIGQIEGCAIVERLASEKILIKEILMPDRLIGGGLKQIRELLTAKDYVVRLPATLGEGLGGRVEPFGMIKEYKPLKGPIFRAKQGYLGIAHD